MAARVDAGGAAGKIQLLDSTDTLLVEIPCAYPVPAAVNGKVDFLGGSASIGSASAGGTVDRFKVVTSADTEVFVGAAGSVTEIGGGGDIELQKLAVVAGQKIRLTSFEHGE